MLVRTSSLLEGWSSRGQCLKLKVFRIWEEHTGDNDDTGLASGTLGSPGKVTRVETKSTVLVVTTAGADGVDALGTDTGVGGLATKLEGSLLPCSLLSEIAFIPSVR